MSRVQNHRRPSHTKDFKKGTYCFSVRHCTLYKDRTLCQLTTGQIWRLTCVWCLFCIFLYSWLSMLLFRLLYNWLLILFFRLLYCWLLVFLSRLLCRLLYRSKAPAGTILFGCFGIPTDSKYLDKTYSDPLINSKVDR